MGSQVTDLGGRLYWYPEFNHPWKPPCPFWTLSPFYRSDMSQTSEHNVLPGRAAETRLPCFFFTLATGRRQPPESTALSQRCPREPRAGSHTL